MAKRRSAQPSVTARDRLKLCRAAMRKQGIGAYLITNPSDAFYLIGFTGEDSAVLVTAREVHVISDGRFDEAINQECPWTTRWLRKGTLEAEIGTVCKKLRIKKLFVQGSHITVHSVGKLREAAKGLSISPTASIVGPLRAVKDAGELRKMRRALKVAEEAFLAMRTTIRVGDTELDLAARLEYEMKRRGASGPAFPTIVAEGKNAALPHAHPGKRKVRKGSAILFDWGARAGGYCSDLTRMVFVGSVPRKIRKIYDIVLQAQRRAIARIEAGARNDEVDAAARDYISDAGHGSAFNHGLGHGLGIDVHEPPSLRWNSNERLRAGAVVTVEPGIYLPGIGGVRIEDDVLVTNGGCRILSTLAKDLDDCLISL